MSDWSNEDLLNFLECYRGEPCIWDPGNSHHKNKKKVFDAWIRLSKLLDKPVKELKMKKDILMGTFRKHLKRKRQYIRAGIKDVYEPMWFAYPLMESFLMPIYKVKLGLDSKTESRFSETADEAEETENDNSNFVPSTSEAAILAPHLSKLRAKSRAQPALKSAEQEMATAISQLTNVLCQRQPRSSDAKDEDECDLYAKLLAKKLKELSKDERSLMMYEIDGLFIKKIKQRSSSRDIQPPQHTPYSRSSSTSIINNSNEPNSSPKPTVNAICDETIVPSKQNIMKEIFEVYENLE